MALTQAQLDMEVELGDALDCSDAEYPPDLRGPPLWRASSFQGSGCVRLLCGRRENRLRRTSMLHHARCSDPSCNHDHSILHLRSACHPRFGLNVAYHKATGRLVVTCKKCEAPVAQIAVASR
jgi:hypothetical protein